MRLDRIKLQIEMVKRGFSVITRATLSSVRGGKSCSYTGVKIVNALGMDLNDLLEVNSQATKLANITIDCRIIQEKKFLIK